jgi:hypothetical protein
MTVGATSLGAPAPPSKVCDAHRDAATGGGRKDAGPLVPARQVEGTASPTILGAVAGLGRSGRSATWHSPGFFDLPLFAISYRVPIHEAHPRQDEFAVERAGGELHDPFAGGGEKDFGGILLNEASGLGFGQRGGALEAADDFDLAGVGRGLGFVLGAEAGGQCQSPFGAGVAGVVPDEFCIEPDRAVGAGVGVGVEFKVRKAVADELECGFHGSPGGGQALAGERVVRRCAEMVRELHPAGRRLK